MRLHSLPLILALALALTLSACGGGGGGGGASSDPPLHGEPSAPAEPDPEPESPGPPEPDPEPIEPTLTFEAVPMPLSGRVRLFEASFAQPGVMFVSTTEAIFGDGAAGIWRSDDGGDSWNKTFDLIVDSISLLSGDPNWVIAGGSNFYAISKTGGSVWEKGEINDPIFGNPQGVVDAAGHTPSEGIFLAVPDVFGPGVYRSFDQGKTWQRVIFSNDLFGLNFVSLSPENPASIYTASNSGIWKSADFGDNFFTILTGVTVGTSLNSGTTLNPRDSDQLFIENHLSVNGGANWSVAALSPRDTFWYRNSLLRIQFTPGRNFLLISQDFGASWRTLVVMNGPAIVDSRNIWKSKDSLFFGDGTQGQIYRIALSEIDRIMDM